MFHLVFTPRAQEELLALQKISRHAGIEKQVKKVLAFLQTDPRHPSLQAHVFHSLENPYYAHEKVFEAYIKQRTPAA